MKRFSPYTLFSAGSGLKGVSLSLGALCLSACLEPQVAPELQQIPSDSFRQEVVAGGLTSPWAVAPLPNGGYLVTGKLGALWLIKDSVINDIDGLPDDIIALADNRIAADGQGGLLDIALASDFAETGEIFLSYAYGNWEENGTALMRARLDGLRLTDVKTIFKVARSKEAGAHYGGKIIVLPDDSLLLSLGDGFYLREEAQKTDTHLGAVVRLTRDGGAAPGNPDFGDGALEELFTIGHRNVQGLAIDPATGAIWQHEHGPRGGDELNRLDAGANYGWPIATYGRDYQGARISPFEDHEAQGFTPPVHVWTPSIAPSGLAIYRGDLFPDWDGHALIGGLASGDLRKVDPETGEEIILLSDAKTENTAFRVRDVDVEADGSVLILIEDQENGRLIRLQPAP